MIIRCSFPKKHTQQKVENEDFLAQVLVTRFQTLGRKITKKMESPGLHLGIARGAFSPMRALSAFDTSKQRGFLINLRFREFSNRPFHWGSAPRKGCRGGQNTLGTWTSSALSTKKRLQEKHKATRVFCQCLLFVKRKIPPGSLTVRPWKWMVGRWVSFWDSLFSGAKMLNFGVVMCFFYVFPRVYICQQLRARPRKCFGEAEVLHIVLHLQSRENVASQLSESCFFAGVNAVRSTWSSKYEQMGVSKNRDTPKWMVYNGKPY